MGESLSEFMERRRREVAGFGRAAEAAAHEAYGKALRVGRDLHLGTSGEVLRFGANLLSGSKLSPAPLKARVGGVGGSTGGLLYSDPDDENAQ